MIRFKLPVQQSAPITTGQILQDPQNRRVIDVMTEFAETLKHYGYHPRVYNTESLVKLSELSPEKKESLHNYFELWNSWIKPEETVDHYPILVDEDAQKRFGKKALAHFGLSVDDSFWRTVGRDDLIEVYGTDMVQLYRSFNFFKYCGYSLLEISVFEWYKLWDRPSMILKEMLRTAEKAMQDGVVLDTYDVPRHILRESNMKSDTERRGPLACLVDFRYIASVYREGGARPAGAIVSSRGELVAAGDAASNIQFV